MIAGLSRPFRPLRRASVPPRPAGLWSLRYAGPALAAAVWVLAVVGPRRGGITPAFLLATTAVLVALTLVDLTAPRGGAAWWRRPLWLGIELALCFALVEIHGTLVRPSLIYLLPAGRAMLMFGGGAGIAWSLSVWVAYGVNIGLDAWPARLGEYPNYFSFFLAPYVLIIVLTRATLRQEADRRRLQALYDALHAAHAERQQLHRQAREAAATAERNRPAREIHDSLAHYLTVVNVQLEAAEKLSAAEPARALEQVQRARRLTPASLQAVRRSVAALRSARPENLALPAALRRLTDEFAGSNGIAVRLAVDLGAGPRWPPRRG
ncbi:MAG: histidine kinase [Dehalococcoidia bacterium]